MCLVGESFNRICSCPSNSFLVQFEQMINVWMTRANRHFVEIGVCGYFCRSSPAKIVKYRTGSNSVGYTGCYLTGISSVTPRVCSFALKMLAADSLGSFSCTSCEKRTNRSQRANCTPSSLYTCTLYPWPDSPDGLLGFRVWSGSTFDLMWNYWVRCAGLHWTQRGPMETLMLVLWRLIKRKKTQRCDWLIFSSRWCFCSRCVQLNLSYTLSIWKLAKIFVLFIYLFIYFYLFIFIYLFFLKALWSFCQN